MDVKEIPLEKIVVPPRAREDMGDIEGLARDIKDKGLLQPITVDSKYNLIAGERRYRACQLAEMKTISCVIRKDTSSIDLLEVEYMENVARKDFTWVERARLEKKIYDKRCAEDPKWSVREQGQLMDESKSAVFRRVELAGMLEDIPELGKMRNEAEAWKAYKKLEEEAIVHELKKTASKEVISAAKWAEDNYIVGDALKGLTKVGAGIMHFVEVDPPYAIELNERKSRRKDKGNLDMYNEVEDKAYPKFVREVAEHCYRILGDNSFCVWWFGVTWQDTVKHILQDVGFKLGEIPCIWYKGGVGQTASPDTMLASSYEPFWLARKGDPKIRKPGRSNVFHYSPVPPQRKIHPTERPIELMREIFQTFVYPGARVCVPFLGSGVTLRAAYMENCSGAGWDLDKLNKRHFINQVMIDAGVAKDEEEDE